VLNWRDDIQLKKDDKILIAGYPSEFTRKEDVNFTNAFTQGEVLTVEKDSDANGKWNAKGLINHGSSGSPVVINKDGQPVAIGIVYARGDVSNGQPYVLGEKLGVAPLLKMLQERVN
jgi:hypothetical protein